MFGMEIIFEKKVISWDIGEQIERIVCEHKS